MLIISNQILVIHKLITMATFGGKYETEKNKQVLKQQSLLRAWKL